MALEFAIGAWVVAIGLIILVLILGAKVYIAKKKNEERKKRR